MSTAPPDEPPQPESNPYEPPKAEAGPIRRARSALGLVAGLFAVMMACMIGFVATCFPIGLVTFSENRTSTALWGYLPWMARLVGGVGAGFLACRLIFRSRRRR